MDKQDYTNLILELLKDKSTLKKERLQLQLEKQELRNKLYNKSKQINDIETEIESLLIDINR